MASEIDGVVVVPLETITDERGSVMHMLRRDDSHFEGFGEVYFSTTLPGVVKAWRLHKRSTANYAVVSGSVLMVLCDMRENPVGQGGLRELRVGEDNYVLVKVPPRVAIGWKCVSTGEAIMANCSTEPYDPADTERIDQDSQRVPYDWRDCRLAE